MMGNILISFCISIIFNDAFGQTIKLPTLKNVSRQGLGISGFSSGGTMASQVHVSHSSIFAGVGILSSVFYRCGQDKEVFYYNSQCQKGKVPVSKAIADARAYEKAGKIDVLTNLSKEKVFIWLGTEDELVKPEIRMLTKNFYDAFVPTSNMRVVTQKATHEFPTDNKGPPCPKPTTNFIGNCNFSGSYETLSFIMGPLRKPSASIKVQALQTFDQAEFTTGTPASVGLYDTGLLYVPAKCTNGSPCSLHLFLHGCAFGRFDKIQEFIEATGYIQMAEENNIVMIFPRASATKNTGGCWDMWGNNDYANKNGAQVKAIRNMIKKIYGDK